MKQNKYKSKYLKFKYKYKILVILSSDISNVNKINNIYNIFSKNQDFINFKEAINNKTKQGANLYDNYPHLKSYIDNYMNDIGILKYYIWDELLNTFEDDVYVRYLLINLYNKYIKNKNILILSKDEIKLLLNR